MVLTGGVEEIRRQYGNNRVEVVYTDAEGLHTDILPAEQGSNAVLAGLMEKGATINAFRELMPRMNDIFIKLVTGEDKL